MRYEKSDEIEQPVDVPIPINRESVCHVDPAAIDRRNTLPKGDLPLHVLEWEKSAEAIVVSGNEL